jgi:hypothetical protein
MYGGYPTYGNNTLALCPSLKPFGFDHQPTQSGPQHSNNFLLAPFPPPDARELNGSFIKF